MKHHKEEYEPKEAESLEGRLNRIKARSMELSEENYHIQRAVAEKHVCTEQIAEKVRRPKETISKNCFLASGIKRINEEDKLFYSSLFSTNDLTLQENRSDEYQKNIRRYFSQFKNAHSLSSAETQLTESLEKRNPRGKKREGGLPLDGGMYISERNRKFNKKLMRSYGDMGDPSSV